MNGTTDLETEATRWLIRRDAGTDASMDEAFREWLGADARHLIAYRRVERLWHVSGRLDAGRYGTSKQFLRDRRRRRSMRALTAVVATASIAVLSFVLWNIVPSWQTYETERGGSERVALNDGSIVLLNTDTRVRVRLTRQKRDVQLLRGEAFFRVAHDTSRPFDVMARGATIRAVGTAFAVRLRSHRVDVLVSEGRVALATAADQLKLADVPAPAAPTLPLIAAGQEATVTRDDVAIRAVDTEEVTRKLAWRTDRLIFRDQPLAEIAEELNRYNRQQIIIDDHRIAHLPFTGVFAPSDVKGFVETLTRSGPYSNRAIRGIRADYSEDGLRVRLYSID